MVLESPMGVGGAMRLFVQNWECSIPPPLCYRQGMIKPADSAETSGLLNSY